MKKKEFNKQLLSGISKVETLTMLEENRIIRMDQTKRRCVVNYLLWHSFSEKGLIKLCQALYFFMNIKRAYDGLPADESEYLALWVDYGDQENEYKKTGLIKMICFSKEKGFKAVI